MWKSLGQPWNYIHIIQQREAHCEALPLWAAQLARCRLCFNMMTLFPFSLFLQLLYGALKVRQTQGWMWSSLGQPWNYIHIVQQREAHSELFSVPVVGCVSTWWHYFLSICFPVVVWCTESPANARLGQPWTTYILYSREKHIVSCSARSVLRDVIHPQNTPKGTPREDFLQPDLLHFSCRVFWTSPGKALKAAPAMLWEWSVQGWGRDIFCNTVFTKGCFACSTPAHGM